MMKTDPHPLRIIALLVILSIGLFIAKKTITPTNRETILILPQSTYYISHTDLNISEIKKHAFHPVNKKHLNLGITKAYIFLHFTLKNSTDKPLDAALVVSSPLMEDMTLYSGTRGKKLAEKGIRYIDSSHTTLPFYFDITLPPKSQKSYYLKIHQTYNAVDFVLTFEPKKHFLEKDRRKQAIDLILIGMVFALMLYSLFLSFYIADKSYFFYGLYLFMLIYQQITYLGLTQVFFPIWFIQLDLQLDIVKLTLLLMTAVLFAMNFLESKRFPLIRKGYQFFLIVATLELLLLSPEKNTSLLTVIIVGILFIVYNLFSAIYIYKNGLKQARLFIIGFGIVSLFYMAMILDTLGITSLMYYFTNAMMWGTAFEAFILSLAFADRYMILQEEKKHAERKILYETQHRTEIVENEVRKKTTALNNALKMKDTLIKEIHHRVKNNLQLILSIIRLQKTELEDTTAKEKLTDLEQRINAISETYQMLINNTDVEEVNMENYVETLLIDISESFSYMTYQINIKTDIDVTLPIKDAVYVGIIINELVTNIYKYAFENQEGEIYIALKENAEYYMLIVSDNGKGYDPQKEKKHLGIRLIHTLVYDQLEGEMHVENEHGTKYLIRFPI